MNFQKKPLLLIILFALGFLIGSIFIPNIWDIKIHQFQSQNFRAVANSANFNSSLGTNLSGIAPWSSQLPFVNHFKSAKTWITQCSKRDDPDCQGEWDTEEENLLDLDQNGWVKSLPTPEDTPKYTRVTATLFNGIANYYRGGQYIVLYDGEGQIEYGLGAKYNQAASSPGRDIIEVDPSKKNGIMLTITTTDPNKTGNYIRNIRVIHSEDENLYQRGEIFNPAFIEKTKRFRSVRFMDWMQTNHSQQKEWQNRPTIEDASYMEKGVPLEVMVALSNQIKADAWFNMPHLATDEYMTNFAQFAKDNLDPDLKIYVEFSNEVWNWIFKQSQYALKQGKARWGEDKGDAFRHWYGMRSAQMCDRWKNVFGNQKERVVCVIATHTAWKGSEKAILDCPLWVEEGNKPCYQHGIDAYAIAGYFGSSLGIKANENQVESWLNDRDSGVSKAFKYLNNGGLLQKDKDSLPKLNELFVYHAQVAEERGLQLVAYEGGQHIVGRQEVVNNNTLRQFFIELNRHPEMYKTYLQLFKNWKQAGGTVFMHFSDIGKPTKWGSWGALEYLDQESSPKFDALMNFLDQTPCWWAGCQSN